LKKQKQILYFKLFIMFKQYKKIFLLMVKNEFSEIWASAPEIQDKDNDGLIIDECIEQVLKDWINPNELQQIQKNYDREKYKMTQETIDKVQELIKDIVIKLLKKWIVVNQYNKQRIAKMIKNSGIEYILPEWYSSIDSLLANSTNNRFLFSTLRIGEDQKLKIIKNLHKNWKVEKSDLDDFNLDEIESELPSLIRFVNEELNVNEELENTRKKLWIGDDTIIPEEDEYKDAINSLKTAISGTDIDEIKSKILAFIRARSNYEKAIGKLRASLIADSSVPEGWTWIVVHAVETVTPATAPEVPTREPEASQGPATASEAVTTTPETKEQEYNKRLKEALDPENHIFLDLGNGQILVMEWNQKVREGILRLEKILGNDKYAVYTMLKLIQIQMSKGKIKTLSEVYKNATEWLNGVQVVIRKWESNDKALLDAIFNTDVQVIEVDKWSEFWNSVLNALTLGVFNIDTANVSGDQISNDSEWRKATSTDFYNWFYNWSYNWSYNWFYYNWFYIWYFVAPKREEKIRPLNENTKERYLANLASKIKEILKRGFTVENVKTTEWKLAKMYLESAWFNNDDIKKVEAWAMKLEPRFIQDEKILKFLKSAENILPTIAWITISENWFVQFNQEVLSWKDSIVKVVLMWVGDDKDTKEVFLSKTKIPFNSLWINENIEITGNIEPIILEKYWIFIQVSNDWVYLIGEWIWNWVDSVSDFVKSHEDIVTALVASLVTAALLWHITIGSIPTPDIDWIWKILTNIWKWSKDWVNQLLDALNIGAPEWLSAWLLIDYLSTSIPLQYKIQKFDTELAEVKAEVKAEFRWGNAIDAELAGLAGERVTKEGLDKYIGDGEYGKEWRNALIHQLLVEKWVFKVWEATWMDFSNVKREENWYTVTVNWIWDKPESRFVINWEKYILEEWEKMTISFDNNLNNPVVTLDWDGEHFDKLRK